MNRPNKYKLYLEKDSGASILLSTKYDMKKRSDKQKQLLESSLNSSNNPLLRQESLQVNQIINSELSIDLCNDDQTIQPNAIETNQHNNSSENGGEAECEENNLPHQQLFKNTHNDNFDDTMFTELRKVMDSETFSTIIKERVNVSIGDIYVMLLKYALTNFLSQAATENLFKMINRLYDRPVIAETRYLIDKLFNPSSTIKYHAQCSSCKQITQFKSLSDKIICKSCTMEINMKDWDFFITLNIAHEIASCLEKYGVHYKYVVNERKHTKHIYSDIYDGSEYRKFLGMLPATHRHSYATLTFNADGAPVFKSSNTSIWPIQIMINELPIHVRTHHPLLGALLFGKSKPDMNVFFDSVCEKYEYLVYF
ncbi:uncharacterized protein LOC141536780 [Cotesia typhae]|uniref:uncharacterized protein LOC141536780 n=1 Tax=Cotesia typhae TaxID=2053667 RepID=UPI003D6846A1